METPPAVGVGRRRIIKRPRLTRMLDKSDARIILLVAPAGYGKTTLAHEWLDEKRATWYRASPASADVAALAVGLASAAAEIVPGAGERMRQRLRATDRPEEDTQILAEILAEDFAQWSDDAWLAIDDYHFAMDAPAPEAFVEALVQCPNTRWIITSRRRPTWATARRRLYGEVLELDRTVLAMDEREARELLSQRRDASSLISQAAGWPAVIGLAALTADSGTPTPQVPASLYDYFAEELLHEASPQTRVGLCRLAFIPSITEESAAHLLEGNWRKVLADSVSAGILRPHGNGQFELHPLLQTFLQGKLDEYGGDVVTSTVRQVGAFLLRSERWDDAVSLAHGSQDQEFIEALLDSGWEEMLNDGRLANLSGLLDLASELRLRSPLLDLVEAEIAFRQASYQKAEALAIESARGLGDKHLLARAYARAGQSAHLEGRDEAALIHHRRAQSLAESKQDKREALWGEFVCAMDFEGSESLSALNRLAELGSDDATDALRLANGQMMVAIRNGTGIDPELFSAVHRLPKVDDPLIRSSFLHVWSCLLSFTGQYREAVDVSERQLREAEQYRLAFVFPHACIRRAVALRGLRQFHEALECLSRIESARGARDDYLTLSADAIRIGIYLATDKTEAALRVPEPDFSSSAAANAIAELIATRALALACGKQLEEARSSARRAIELSTAAEPRLLARFALAVTATLEGSRDAAEIVTGTFQEAIASDNIDGFVTTYRAFPPLLGEIGANEQWHSRLARILSAAGDLRLAGEALPERLVFPLVGTSLLSKRERDVLELVSQGLKNREIGEKLFISEVTVKAHVRNILKKLGARSRAHAVSLTSRMD